MTPDEAQAEAILRDEGWTVLRYGWPDFLAIDTVRGRAFAIEVKSERDDLSRRQRAMREALERVGLPVAVWRATEGRYSTVDLLPAPDHSSLMVEFERLLRAVELLRIEQKWLKRTVKGLRQQRRKLRNQIISWQKSGTPFPDTTGGKG